MNKKLGLILILMLLNSTIYAQTFNERMNQVYAFKVAELSPEQLESKYKELDLFWQELNKDSLTLLPKIREELQKSGRSSYFYFDMSSYLEMISNKEKDKDIISKALGFIVFSDINNWELVDKMKDFSSNGIKVDSMLKQLLNLDKLKISNPETKEVFNQGKIVSYIALNSTHEIDFSAIFTNFNELKTEAQRSVVTALWLRNSKNSNKLLQEITNTIKDVDVRAYASRLFTRYNPTEGELLAYKDLSEEERVLTLKTEWKNTLAEWNNQTWNKLISISKVMHFYQIELD